MKITFTNALCKYKLCGIITAPITPTACVKVLVSQSLQYGINIPSATSAKGGDDFTNWNMKK